VLFGTVAAGTGVAFEVAARTGLVAGEDGFVEGAGDCSTGVTTGDAAVSAGRAVPAGVASSGFVFTVSDTAGLSLVQAARKAAVVRATRQALFIGYPFSVMQL
jgi:hypothetical protein